MDTTALPSLAVRRRTATQRRRCVCVNASVRSVNEVLGVRACSCCMQLTLTNSFAEESN